MLIIKNLPLFSIEDMNEESIRVMKIYLPLFFLVILAVRSHADSFTVIDKGKQPDSVAPDAATTAESEASGDVAAWHVKQKGTPEPDTLIEATDSGFSKSSPSLIVIDQDGGRPGVLSAFPIAGKHVSSNNTKPPPGGGNNPSTLNPQAVPEPSTWLLLFASLAGLAIFRHRRKAQF